jgi:type II secretory ATPase GspE/PulE/Tfp pilus assembly ATPase PilB-like protein
MSDQIKRIVSVRASAHEIRERALEEGMVSLRADAVQKVAANATTLAEVMRCVWLN